MKKAKAALAASLMAPAVALAFESVDSLPWPSMGRFPAYPAEAARPTTFWLQGGLMHDDNILRLEANEQSDTVGRLGAGIRHEQRVIGRQSVVLEARADYYDFQDLTSLDHLAYAGFADWRWEVGNKLSGSVLLGTEERLADLSETRSATKTMVTLHRASADGGYLVTPNLRLRAGAGWSRSERDDQADPEIDATSLVIGADYLTPLGNRVGLEARNTEGEAPADADVFGTLVSNDFTERELSFVVGYRLGTRLGVDGRVGRTKRSYEELPSRNFDDNTWRVGVEWFPANKTSLVLTYYNEPRSIIDVSASHVVVKGFSFGPSWAPTQKVVLSARVLREDQKFAGDPAAVLAGTTLRDETVDAVRLAVGWEPQRFWHVGLALDRGERTSNISGRGYEFTTVMANVAWRY